MQTRVAFNSGEFSPDMACRSDLEQYQRGCATLENWQVSQMGGVRRRKGMRYVATALSDSSRLIPYIYSYEDKPNMRYLVEVNNETVRVLDMKGYEQARFDSTPNGLTFHLEPDKFRYYQQNKLLFITSLDNAPLVLEYDGISEWTLKNWQFKHRPWSHYDELRDWEIEIRKEGANFEVSFPDDVPMSENAEDLLVTDYLRASFWLEQAEEKSVMREILNIKENPETNKKEPSVKIVTSVPQSASYLDTFAISTEEIIKYWVCKADWATSNYVDGLESPANYTGAFAAAEDIEGFEDIKPIYSLRELKDQLTILKGTKIAMRQNYWEYYTCIKDYDGLETGGNGFKDYPGYFIRGLAVGKALPSRGKWSFYCSGVWFGSYEVRRNYETSSLDANWEDRGISFSRNDAASNTSISGTEADEECFLRLFLTRSRRMQEDGLTSGFPPDGCGNRLIVEGYKHDMILKASPTVNPDTGRMESLLWECDDLVQLNWSAYRTVKDWSWAAFSARSGYPLHCCVFQQRLVFASTKNQPLTTWFSRVDDIDNFLRGDVDDAAITLTLSAPSQNPICWVQAQDDRLMLGTSAMEYSIVSSSQNLAFSATSARARAHSHVGSDGTPAIAAISKAVFVERGAMRIHEYGWNEESGGYIPRELSVFAPHIGTEHGGFIYPTLLSKPDVMLVWTLGDGQLALCTYNDLQEVRAWHRWVTDGKILSACGMPNGKKADSLYLIVKREDKTETGLIIGESVNIEVIDEDSQYYDNGERDYDSLLVTNPLFFSVQERVGRRNDNSFWIRFGTPFEYEEGSLTVSTDGGKVWRSPDWLPGVAENWKEAKSDATWQYEKQAGIRVHGNRGCHILGLQG